MNTRRRRLAAQIRRDVKAWCKRMKRLAHIYRND